MTRFKYLLLGSIGAALLFTGIGNASAVELANLLVNQTGMQRISYATLAEYADFAGVRHQHFAVTRNGEKVAVHTQGQDKAFGKKSEFGPGGYIEFYGEAADSVYTNDAAYTLHLDKELREVMGKKKLKFDKKKPSANNYLARTVIESNSYYDYLSPSKSDPWHYGQIIAQGGTAGPTYQFNDLTQVAGNTADMDVEVFGIIDLPDPGNDHHVEIFINGVAIGDSQFDGVKVETISADNVAINNGVNDVRVALKGIENMPLDAAALNKIRVSYQRNTVAEGDYLQGRFAAGQAQATGFSGDQLNVYRIDDAGEIRRITGGKSVDANTFGFGTGNDAAEFIVVNESGYKQPHVAMIHDEQDINSGKAEYLIITHDSFFGPALDSLVQLRQADYSVKVVDVAQIYGQFGHHVPSADAIHAYVKHAAANMGTRFVTLIGGDTYDYKNYASQSISFIPTYYATTPGGQLLISQTPSDAKYGDLDGDDIPDIPVGRISARTPAELANVVEKINDYQARVGYSGRILIAADKEDVGNSVSFTDDANDLVDAIPQDLWRNSVTRVNGDFFRAYPDVDGAQAAKNKLITALNSGVSVAAYIGHSSQHAWAFTSPKMLTTSDVIGLTNFDKPALITQWGCWNTYFVDPDGNSMGDKFLVDSAAGAVTVLGASTLTTSNGERLLGMEMNQRMYAPNKTIGEAIIEAKQAMAATLPGATDIYLGWQILGDPALVVSPQ
ncbi:MAG: hypothetical protein HKN50_11045 [Gammaproteobacteria bacterium]|nr:hypothetical protein [Gammaproteobacteria bacterium]